MWRLLVALTLTALPSIATAAPPTCRDLLVRATPREYACEGERFLRGGLRQRDKTPFTVDQGAFWADTSGHSFNITFGEGLPMTCACDPQESRTIAGFFRSREFICSRPVPEGGSVALHGSVSGRDGSRVVLKTMFEDGGLVASSSVLYCRPAAPAS